MRDEDPQQAIIDALMKKTEEQEKEINRVKLVQQASLSENQRSESYSIVASWTQAKIDMVNESTLTKDSLEKTVFKELKKSMDQKLYHHTSTEKATQFLKTLYTEMAQQDEKLCLLVSSDVRIDLTKEKLSDLNAIQSRLYHGTIGLMTAETRNFFETKIDFSSMTLMADLVSLIQERATDDFATAMTSFYQFIDLKLKGRTIQSFTTRLERLAEITKISHPRLAQNDMHLVMRIIQACSMDERFQQTVNQVFLEIPKWQKEAAVTYSTFAEREAVMKQELIDFLMRIEQQSTSNEKLNRTIDDPGKKGNRNEKEDKDKTPKNQLICTFCNRKGHDFAHCFARLRQLDQQSQATTLAPAPVPVPATTVAAPTETQTAAKQQDKTPTHVKKTLHVSFCKKSELRKTNVVSINRLMHLVTLWWIVVVQRRVPVIVHC
mmetsp:Transcript_8635/g.22013  ORF Transcript_8635/g.22013 Transcript_8635/m.22013 type:complete len:435 (+) Transcript_8635:820-2124(+)